ncbi:hypothetical protein WT71_11305 [Burkholderia stagnalis]|nr:hypothetical protein WT71_11305 [Burkholderia stagnalis]KWI81812.1 hypothetical protein WT73_02950 [Burkholderia stagnalis]
MPGADHAPTLQEKKMSQTNPKPVTNRKPARWREVEGALEVTALAAVECALVLGLLTALGIPHGGL